MNISDKQRSFFYAAALTIIMMAGGLLLSNSTILKRFNFVLYDLLLPLQNNTISDQIVVVAIDDASIQALGRWPWSRSYHAQLLDQLTSMGARAVGFDILFSEQQKNDPLADLQLTQALQRNAHTVLAVAPVQLTSLDPISEILPFPELAAAAAAVGHVDAELDFDGLCRRFFLYAGLNDAHWPAFALALLQTGGELGDMQPQKQTASHMSTGWLRQKMMLIPYGDATGHLKILSYSDVLAGRIPTSEIKNKYVLIGATAAGLGDAISTPMSRSQERMHGVILNAQIASALLQGIRLNELSPQSQRLVTLFLIFLTALLILPLSLRAGFIAMLISVLGISATSVILLIGWHLWFPPFAALLISAMFWPLWSIWQAGVENRLKNHLLQRLKNQMQHHIATGLPNHLMLEEKLRLLNHSEAAPSGVAALMVMHINWPGSASIILGRPMADHILQTISERLNSAVKGEHFIAHLNGDDFAILLTDLNDVAAAKTAAVSLLGQLQQPMEEGGQRFLLAPQIGVSTWDSDGDATELLRNAYAAMFKSRIDDVEHLCIYSAEVGQQLQVRSQVEQALITALERNEFEVHYQPQINANSGEIVGVEALLRWHSPLLGWVRPDSFIPIAEHVGLIKNIGSWVLDTACKQLQEWHKQGLTPLRLAVNVSPLQFVDPGLLVNIRTIVKQAGITSKELELEITESSLMFNLDNTVNIMHKIKNEGIELAIDDFGTGYSSLSNIRHFPLDRLKIDQSFTREIGKNDDATEITLTILSMAKHLGLEVIAEGVETVEQADFLREHGCEEFQGYLFSKPLSAKNLTLLLQTGIKKIN